MVNYLPLSFDTLSQSIIEVGNCLSSFSVFL